MSRGAARPNPRLTPEALWPAVAGATTFAELARRLYARGIMDLPFGERCAIAAPLADRLGLEVSGQTFRDVLKPCRHR